MNLMTHVEIEMMSAYKQENEEQEREDIKRNSLEVGQYGKFVLINVYRFYNHLGLIFLIQKRRAKSARITPHRS